MTLLTDLQARDNITDDDDNGNTVPLLMQNKVPVKDDSTKADVELRPDEVRGRTRPFIVNIVYWDILVPALNILV